MRGCTLSPQEEETLALAAVSRLGEATAHEIALELGVEVIRHTLGRLVDSGRLVKRRDRNRAGNGDVFVFSAPVKKQEAHAATL